MNKFHHLFVASLIFIVFYLLFGSLFSTSSPNVMLGFLICLTYSLIPDLDLKNSRIKEQLNIIIIYLIIILGVLFFITGAVEILIVAAVLVFIEIVLQFIKHRTLLHSPFIGLLLAIPLYFINQPNLFFFVSGFLGYFSHWLADKF